MTVNRDRVNINISNSVCIVKNGKMYITMNSPKSAAIFKDEKDKWHIEVKKGILHGVRGVSAGDISIMFQSKDGNKLPLLGVTNYAEAGNYTKDPRVKLLDLESTVTVTSSGITTEKNPPVISKKLPY